MNSIIWKDCVDSTNNEVKRLAATLENKSVIAAAKQFSGRGQADHKWHSEAGLNLTFTILYRPLYLEVSELESINHAVCLGIIHYLEEKSVHGRIKWPNDIWVGEKKICGLLIENTLESRFVRESIIGVGFNLNQTSWPEDLPNPVSLKELCHGRNFQLPDEMTALTNEICRRLDLMDSRCGRVSLQEEFEKYVFRPEKEA